MRALVQEFSSLKTKRHRHRAHDGGGVFEFSGMQPLLHESGVSAEMIELPRVLILAR